MFLLLSAASKLPLNMLSTMNSRPQKMKKIIKLHSIPAPFQSIYPKTAENNFQPAIQQPTLSNDHLRFDRTIVPDTTGRYQPLISGCPLLDSHQVGPVRLVSIGSVIFPPQQSIYSVVRRSPNLRLCRDIIDNAQMTNQLNTPSQTFTMFTPTDSAIRKRYSPRELNSIIRNRQSCRGNTFILIQLI